MSQEVALGQMAHKEKLELLRVLHEREVTRCAESFEHFFMHWVRTKDEHDAINPVKRVPNKPYLSFVAREFQHGPEVQYYAKSRQLMVSWLLCAFAVWKAQFQPHALVLFQSKKLEDAARMVFDTTPNIARCSFIMAHLPKWLQVCIAVEGENRVLVPFSIDQKTFSYGSVKFPNGAMIEALAQGASQVEGKVPALIISDESSLQEEWAESWAAAMPCIAGGGRAVAVATMRLPSQYGEEIAPCDDVDPDSEMRGVARFKTARGGSGVRLHYSADPDKDPRREKGRAWFANETVRMRGGFEGNEWQQHMEINPQSVSGQKCIPYWSKIEDRVVIDDIPYEQAALWALGGGADYGTRNPTVLLICAVDFHGNLYVVDEVAAPGMTVQEIPGITKGGVAGIAQLWHRHPLFQRINGKVQMDPTTEAKTQNIASGLTSVSQLFREEGIYLQPASARGTEADDLTLNRLHQWWAGFEEPDWAPQFFICKRCTGLIQILRIARYADWSSATQDVNNLKPKMRGCVGMDYFDALKHWVCSLPQGPARTRAAAPQFSFQWLRAKVRSDRHAVSRLRN